VVIVLVSRTICGTKGRTNAPKIGFGVLEDRQLAALCLERRFRPGRTKHMQFPCILSLPEQHRSIVSGFSVLATAVEEIEGM